MGLARLSSLTSGPILGNRPLGSHPWLVQRCAHHHRPRVPSGPAPSGKMPVCSPRLSCADEALPAPRGQWFSWSVSSPPPSDLLDVLCVPSAVSPRAVPPGDLWQPLETSLASHLGPGASGLKWTEAGGAADLPETPEEPQQGWPGLRSGAASGPLPAVGSGPHHPVVKGVRRASLRHAAWQALPSGWSASDLCCSTQL